MQIDINTSADIAQLINEAKSIAIIPSKIAGLDAYAAGAALNHMLKEIGKPVHFIYPGALPEGSENIISSLDIVNTLQERDLVVSVNYQGTNVESVKYNTEDNILTFRLGPIPADFDAKSNVHAKVSTYEFDLCFVIGAQNLENLGSTYEVLQSEIHASKIVNIDITKSNTRFGVVNMIEPEVDSLSYLIFQKAAVWDLPVPKPAALALLRGMSIGAQNLIL
jgi:nanoRNase/pAp phosphatase (c-di-AMP/oligoRNAs hydrolase)